MDICHHLILFTLYSLLDFALLVPEEYYSTLLFVDFGSRLNLVMLYAAGYLHIIHQMKELITGAGKKAYTLVMGKPNPAKLANFPEVFIRLVRLNLGFFFPLLYW